MLRAQDVLTGMHANAQIPKVIGMERIYQLTGDPNLGRAARFFWDDVVRTRSFVIVGTARTSSSSPGCLRHPGGDLQDRARDL